MAGSSSICPRFNPSLRNTCRKAEGVNLPAGLFTRLAEGFEEALPVLVVEEDGFPAVAAVHDVVDGAGVLDSEFAGHERRVAGW